MPIEATNPTTISATYDKWAFTFTTGGDGCVSPGEPPSAAAPVTAMATLVKARIRDDGAWERSPDPADVKHLFVPDLYALAQTDAAVGAALAALITAVESVAQAQDAL